MYTDFQALILLLSNARADFHNPFPLQIFQMPVKFSLKFPADLPELLISLLILMSL